MSQLLLCFWDRLNLMVRLLLVLVLCMLLALIGAAYQSARDTTIIVQHTIESELRQHLDNIESFAKAAIIYNKDNSDPMISLKTVFEGAEYSPEMVQISFRDTSDVVSISYDKPLPLRAPKWFGQWCGLEEFSANRALVIDGLYYGVLTLRISPNDAINRAWNHYLRQMRILLVIFVLVWLSVSWVLHQGLHPIKSLARAYDALGRSEFSTRLEIRGSPELRTSLSNFNEMALKIEASRNELAASEERFRVLFEHAPDAIVVYDFDLNRFVDANARAEELFGYPREELLKIEPRYFFPANQAERLEVFESFFQQPWSTPTDEIIATELALLNAEGKKRVCSVHLVMLPDENKKLNRASFIDITERRRAEDALRESEALLSVAGRTAQFGGWSAEPDGRKVVWSEQVALIHEKEPGYSPILEEAIRYYAPEWREKIARLFDACARQGTPYDEELEIITAGDRRLWVRTTGEAIRDSAGKIIRVQGSLQNITDRKREDEEREKLKAQLQQAQKMEAVGTLAGGISHDFNNLLQAINGYTQLLLMEKSDSDPEYNALVAIQNAGFRAAELVRQLLLFSRKADTKKRPLDLQHEVEQAQKILERTIPKMIRIQVIFESRLWSINADSVQIEQMLLNLGTNAADAMLDGGKLVFEIQNTILDDDYATHHLGAQPGRYVVLTVSDTGHGVDKENIEKMFDPFFTTKAFGKGTGLGLASVYGIVTSHGGYITCYSEVGQGTTFKIYFPAIVLPDVEEINEVESKPISRGAETLLLVDDEEAIRGFAQQALMKFGYKVMTASTGEEALKLFKEWDGKFALVIMDLGMPGKGGYKCLQELLQIDPGVKVIIASGYSINGQVKIAMEAGAKGYVGKPYQLADLLNTVRTVLD